MAKKKSGSEEQSSVIAENTEISEMTVIINSVQDNKTLADYAETLQNWTLASENPFSTGTREDLIGIIVYGNGRFVASGKHYIPLAYSDDGDTWHIVKYNVFGESFVGGMAYGNGRFVAATYGFKTAYSDNGETWTLVEDSHLGNNYSIDGIAYGNGCFVAVGYNDRQRNGIIAYSDNGEEWTLVEDGSLDIEIFRCIVYGNGKFIAGGSHNKAAYSNDGKTWTVIPGDPFRGYVRVIAYGSGRFVAYSHYFQSTDGMVTYSDDGINWTAISEDELFRPVYNIVYANGLFIAVGHRARMTYSIDGETWYPGSDGNGFTIRVLEGGVSNLSGIAYGNGRFVIGSDNGLNGSSAIAWCEMPAVNIDDDLKVSAENEAIHIDNKQK